MYEELSACVRELRYSVATLTQVIAGQSRRRANPPAGPIEFGVGNSGAGDVSTSRHVGLSSSVEVLNVNARTLVRNGCDGLATVHFYVVDRGKPHVGAEDFGNSVLKILISWQSGIAGGKMVVDATRGTFVTLAANDVITANAWFESAIDGEPIRQTVDKRVEAVVKFFTSANPQPPWATWPITPIAAGGFSAWYDIPRQAKKAGGLLDVPAAYATMFAEFASAPQVAAIRYVSPIGPVVDVPVVQGVEWVRFGSATACNGFPVFTLTG